MKATGQYVFVLLFICQFFATGYSPNLIRFSFIETKALGEKIPCSSTRNVTGNYHGKNDAGACVLNSAKQRHKSP